MEKNVEYWANKIEEGERVFSPDNEPPPEFQPLIISVLNERGYKAEFFRSKDSLSVLVTETPAEEGATDDREEA